MTRVSEEETSKTINQRDCIEDDTSVGLAGYPEKIKLAHAHAQSNWLPTIPTRIISMQKSYQLISILLPTVYKDGRRVYPTSPLGDSWFGGRL